MTFFQYPQYVLILACVLTITSCRSGLSGSELALPPTNAYHSACTDEISYQTSYPDFANDYQRDINCMMTELKYFQTHDKSVVGSHPLQPYFAYKAQAWLDYAYAEFSEGSLTAAGDVAFNKGRAIYHALNNDRIDSLLISTDIPPTSALMRPALWAMLMAIKHHNGAVVAPRELAFGEVQLVWAATEYCKRGWRHSSEHFEAAERRLAESREVLINTITDDESVQLEEDTHTLYQAYLPFDPTDDICRGQTLPITHDVLAPPL